MNRIPVVLVLAAMFSQPGSPDGKWRIQSVSQDRKPVIAICDATGNPVGVIDRDTKGSQGISAKWSSDSRGVVLLDQAPLGSGISAAWFDGGKWHATVESDTDVDRAEALAKSQGVGGVLKAEDRALGDWISRDTIQVHGTLHYLSGKKFSYSYDLQIVPGSYSLNRGGFETGGLKASNFRAG
jgi:hypothetical protein